MTFYHVTQNDVQYKIYKFLAIFFLIFLDHICPHVAETTEIETTNEGGEATI